MVVAMVAIRMMQMACHEVVDVIAVQHDLMSVVGSVPVAPFMTFACVFGIAGGGFEPETSMECSVRSFGTTALF